MKLLQGNNLPLLRLMEENSIDTIITDPPYGLKFMSKKWDYDVPDVELWQECLRVLKPGGTLLCFAGSRTQHRMAVNVEDAGFILKDCIMWLYGSGFPKALDISKAVDGTIKHGRSDSLALKQVNHERPGEATIRKSTSNGHKGFVGAELEGSTEKRNTPATPEAKLWNGWKSHGLKPAYEPILVAMKPNDGTYANNALKHGVSGLNIDGGRIETKEDLNGGAYKDGKNVAHKSWGYKPKVNPEKFKQPQGRFPANLLHDGLNGEEWARYFYCAKASKKERNAGCEGLEEKEGYTEETPTPQRDKRKQTFKANHHPTVKPLALMEYLCTLTKTPTGGVVLDPFMGSGTTGLAAQNTEREFIGIEMDAEYYRIANARIQANKK
jgi:site-specific DNA-methyltransferase (adenine-specific)